MTAPEDKNTTTIEAGNINTGDGLEQGAFAAEIVGQIMALLHEEARREIINNIANVITWVQSRIEQLGIQAVEGEKCILTLNPYNEKGLGIQSVSIGFTKNGEAARPGDEFKDPTIGVITSGLIDDVSKVTKVGFDVGEGNCEHLVKLSEGLKLDSCPADQIQEGEPAVFDGPIDVAYPNQARTILETTAPDAVEHVGEIEGETNHGVYACIYRKLKEKPA